MAYEDPLPVTPELSDYVLSPPTKDNLGVDNVYMINLERRPDRRTKMDTCLNELGIKYQWVKAVDGKKVCIILNFLLLFSWTPFLNEE